MSADTKDATSCCTEEADPSAASSPVDLCTGVNVYVCACSWLGVCVLTGHSLMRTTSPDCAEAECRGVDCAEPLQEDK